MRVLVVQKKKKQCSTAKLWILDYNWPPNNIYFSFVSCSVFNFYSITRYSPLLLLQSFAKSDGRCDVTKNACESLAEQKMPYRTLYNITDSKGLWQNSCSIIWSDRQSHPRVMQSKSKHVTLTKQTKQESPQSPNSSAPSKFRSPPISWPGHKGHSNHPNPTGHLQCVPQAKA